MDLILWRHAEAEDGVPDAARALTAEGRRQARVVARWLGGQLPEPVRILVSPARRAQETARALRREFETSELLAPGATRQALLAAAEWPEAANATLIVGHQPVLGELACFLMSGQDGGWSVRKGALWWFRSRRRGRRVETVLRTVIGPESLP